MTRFARAKGSKSSNQKAPEDSTPWEVMKEQIIQSKKESEEAKNREEAEQKRIDNYSNFLKEQKVQKRKATWCDFPEAEVNKKIDNDNKVEQNEKSHKKKNKNKKTFEETQSQSSNETQGQTDDTNQTNISVKQKKKDKKNKVTVQNNEDKNHVDNSVEKVELNNTEQLPNGNLSKKTKKKKSQQSQNNNKNDETKEGQSTKTDAVQETVSNKNNSQVKKKKNSNQKPTRRKDVNDRSFQLIVNGKEIELIRFDGFPIMKKDAERLTELKNNMIKKGIPKSEVQRTMKLERRRAEKALARMKREVCYNCRKGGHNLSDCPELKSKIPGVDSAEGVCFKCGSTEHRQFECKVQRDKEFRFATCFICKEAGHIARQCPDNPKGLYPNGGCCKLCGDVTHLKKDCPTMKDKREETSIKLNTLSASDNLEDIAQKTGNNVTDTIKKPKKIKF
ncbi:PREDICTED: zinc finger CCHC domain-containing protein 9-like [Papilio polytes]|uniref:zinc finger CCHC domain-containing protein 9-like n=1 Tax=Papilio polytes TaxID=76194 RepID=UPI000675E3F2|nr:PREDICTED: zinc finger CCHC domain-containing protein 9-like [Papilio polytes]